ncbi:MAG: methionine--tRNA ligase subunit beta, partial [Pirellulales bacterium]|nr:methionine--tRNA ligase subunit beta [Pirellulales bacterium]
APWKIAKTDPAAAGTALYHALEVVRLATGMLSPIMPEKCAAILSRLQLKTSFDFDDFFHWGVLQAGTPIVHGEPVFPRLELQPAEKIETSEQEKQPDNKNDETAGVITIEDFSCTELKTALILKAERVDGTDRLLKLQVDIGDSSRQLVAGIAEYYSPEDLPGRTILVVTNLKPAVIRGIESHGMLLAAKKGRQLVLATFDGDIPPGTVVS